MTTKPNILLIYTGGTIGMMKDYKTSLSVYAGLYAALFFSLVISYNGVVALLDYF